MITKKVILKMSNLIKGCTSPEFKKFDCSDNIHVIVFV